MRLTCLVWGVAVPAQPADFQAEVESDTRIQLSWLLPPQERIIMYELVYWVAEDEDQQVCSGQRSAEGVSWSLRVCNGLNPRRVFSGFCACVGTACKVSAGGLVAHACHVACTACMILQSYRLYDSLLGAKSPGSALNFLGSVAHLTGRALKVTQKPCVPGGSRGACGL